MDICAEETSIGVAGVYSVSAVEGCESWLVVILVEVMRGLAGK